MTLKISSRGFKLLRPVSKKSRCRVKILNKKGLPFIFNRYRKRKAFLIGVGVFVLMFYALTSFIWSVEVNGNKSVETHVIMEKLAALGIKDGMLKYKINTDQVAEQLILSTKELAWVGVVLKGTKLKVEVVERVIPPVLVPKDQPCNIIAKKDGMIKSLVVKAGQEAVKVGDTVQKGQLLVSAEVKNKNEQIPSKIVHAMGTVKARTWYERSIPVDVKKIDTIKTGKIKKNYTLRIFSKEINLFHGSIPYRNYDKIELKKKLSIGENLVFPLEWIVEEYHENQLEEKKIELEEAKEIATALAYEEVMKEIPETAEIVNSEVSFMNDENGGLSAGVVVECLEDIGMENAIGGN